MKTPKRYMNKPLPMLPEDNVVDDWIIEIWCARAKRKNKIAQLKRSLEKYKYGTHLSSPLAAIYRRLQCVVRPGKHASSIKWANYLNGLRMIQESITCEITNAAILLAFDAERKEKERKGMEK